MSEKYLKVVDIKDYTTTRNFLPYSIWTFEEVIFKGEEPICSGKKGIKRYWGKRGNGNPVLNDRLYSGEIKEYKTTEYFIDGIRYNSISVVVSDNENGIDIAANELKYYAAFPYDQQENIYNPNQNNFDIRMLIEKAKQIKGVASESSFHQSFKNFIANNPTSIGLPATVNKGQIEYCLPSCDLIDVFFVNDNTKIGVEVKSKKSDMADILRGFFQCIKYKHLIEAEQRINNEHQASRVILALEGELPTELMAVKNILGIEVIDKIKMDI